MIRKTSSLLLFILAVSLVSCNSNIIYTDSIEMPDKVWRLSDVPDFSVPVTDTAVLTNVIFTIRTGSDYPFRNLFLFVSATSPEGRIITDTLEYVLADEKGNWYGKGFGDIHELDLPYKSGVFFPVLGTYRFKIQHGMRLGDLRGVYDLGLRIEKSIK